MGRIISFLFMLARRAAWPLYQLHQWASQVYLGTVRLMGHRGRGCLGRLYVGLGFTFGENFAAIASLLGNASGLITALVMTIGLGFWLIHAARAKNDKAASA